MFEQMKFIFDQLTACEPMNGNVLPISNIVEGTFVTIEGVWDCFLFRQSDLETMEIEEKARGLWYSIETIEIDDNPTSFNLLKCNSKNRIHFAGFIADLLLKLCTQNFSEALEKTISEWRTRWNLRINGLSFIERLGLFGELVVLRDLLVSNKIDSTENWTARKQGDGLHDFVFDSQKFEVKTTLRSEGEIHIFHEHQMHHQEELFLLLLKVDIFENGESIDEVCNDITSKINSEQEIDFLAKLSNSGFVFGKYTTDRFIIRAKKYWKSLTDSPFIQPEDIRQDINRPKDINYYVLESHIDFEKVHDFSEIYHSE